MTTITPNYYKDFCCTADKCTRSCCTGWEIDIDEDTMNYYSALEGKIGELVMSSISNDGQPHFRLKSDMRCPLLMDNGLCTLICELGDGALCEICSEHPRFHNYYTYAEEIGLGICCEEAARLIMTSKEKFALVTSYEESPEFTKEEQSLLSIRQKAIDIMTNRDNNIQIRMRNLKKLWSGKMPFDDIKGWSEFYITLERLDDKWTELVVDLGKSDVDIEDFSGYDEEIQIALEQLAVYFLFRHITAESNSAQGGIGFAYVSCALVSALYKAMGCKGIKKLIDIAIMYSQEIEYSDTNPDLIMKAISDI